MITMIRRSLFGAAVGMLLSAMSAFAQAPAVATPTRTLAIAGDATKATTLTPADLRALPRTRVEVKEDPRIIVYEGVLVGELLKRAGSPAGADMRGNAVASYVSASATDGWNVSNWSGSASKFMNARWFAAASILWLATATAALPAQPQYAWTLPAGFPPPMVPADNPMTVAKVELGRHLFYDTRLSARQAVVRQLPRQSQAFAESRAKSIGSTGQLHPRSSMSLVNVAYAQTLTWGDRTQTKLEAQAMVPMYEVVLTDSRFANPWPPAARR